MADLVTERQQFEAALRTLLANFSGGGSGEIPAARLTLTDMVKAKLDEIIPGTGISFSLDAENDISDPYSLLINSLLDESAKRVLQSAPIYILTPKLNYIISTPVDDNTGYIALPPDFLRIASLKMEEWKREVTDFITPADGRYKLQHNKYTRGGVAKPVAVLTYKQVNGETGKVVEYYSVNSSHTVEHLYYIPETLAEDLQSNLTDALTWTCAGMILQVTERVDLAKFAFEQASVCYQNL